MRLRIHKQTPVHPLARLAAWAWLGLVVLSLMLTGCGQSDIGRLPVYPAQGHISYEGASIPGAFLVLHPVDAGDANAPRPTAKVREDGSFVLSTYSEDDGAPSGQYKVTVQWRPRVERNGEIEPGPNELPQQYARPQTSPLTVEIAASPNDLPLEVVR